jgi:hypothetical protein
VPWARLALGKRLDEVGRRPNREGYRLEEEQWLDHAIDPRPVCEVDHTRMIVAVEKSRAVA